MIEHLRDLESAGKFGYALGQTLYQAYWYRPIRAILSWRGSQVDGTLEDALSLGLSFYGVDTYRVGPLSSLALRATLSKLQADCGVRLTALPKIPGQGRIEILTDNGEAVPKETAQTIQNFLAQQPDVAQPPPIDRSRVHLPSPIG